MMLRDAIQQLEQFATQMGDDAIFKLHDRATGRDVLCLPDFDRFEFEILRGDNEVVIEFD